MIQKIKEWASVVAAIVAIALLAVVLVGGNQSASFGRTIPGYSTYDSVGTTQLAVGTGCNDAFGTSCAGVFISTAGAISASSSIDILGALTQGGGIRATSTVNSTETLLSTDFDTENVIDYTANVSSVTLTLPASTTLSSFVPTAAQCRTVFIRNATTTSSITLTLAGGTGTLLKGVATSSASTVPFKTILGNTDGSNMARIDFCRKANTDIIANMIPFN